MSSSGIAAPDIGVDRFQFVDESRCLQEVEGAIGGRRRTVNRND